MYDEDGELIRLTLDIKGREILVDVKIEKAFDRQDNG